VVSTGTCGGGRRRDESRGYLKVGQRVRIEISGLGRSRNEVIPSHERREALIRTAAACGVELCFANPGTTEMHLVAALDAAPGVRAVLGLFEGVVTGAADGYARLAGKPALTLLHLGPGFANGIANLHNARRAHSPIVNLIGDQATWHLAADAPLTSDIESLARPVSRWVRKSATAAALPGDLADAVAAARNGAGGVAIRGAAEDHARQRLAAEKPADR
jgi:acetolactate synthase-1/2/3 large subunit